MKNILRKHDACASAIEWVGDKTVKEAVNECPKGEWMLWMASELNLDKRKLTLAKGLCAETVKHLMTDKRSVKSVEGAIAYGKGEIDENELEALSKDAYDAATATYDAYITADAAAYAAYAATYSAADAAAAAETAETAEAAIATYLAAEDAADATDREANEKQTADVCLEVFGEWLIEELNKLKQSK